MPTRALAQEFAREAMAASSTDHLHEALQSICTRMGFQHFALSHHVDVLRANSHAIRLHNYPTQWAEYYDAHRFGVSDPVHRASHVTSVGFAWSRLPKLIPLTRFDRHMLELGREQGIGDGFTVPANVPGEMLGSCSFANRVGVAVDEGALPLAQLVGLFAFESARRLSGSRPMESASPRLTDRQRDCVMWVGRGKSDWETGRILGISEETVDRHLRHARERYGVAKRTSVLIRALFDGTLSFADVLGR